jgi:hypothetical protein
MSPPNMAPSTVTAFNEDGSPYSQLHNQTYLYVDVYKIASGEQGLVEPPSRLDGNKITINPDPGTYFLEITEVEEYWMQPIPTGRRAMATVSVAEGEIESLQVWLSRRSPLISGWVSSTSQDAIPGTALSLRAEFGLAPDTAGSAVKDARLCLDVPPGTTLVEDSVVCLIDGEVIQAMEVHESEAGLSVDFGDLDLTEGRRWVTLYQVTVDEGMKQGTLSFRAQVDYVTPGGEETSDHLQSREIPMVAITINVPQYISSLKALAWGRGPRGATVSVFDGDLLLGVAPVSPAGFWYLPIKLPDFGRGSIHRLRSRADLADGPVFSDEITSVYDPGRAELVEVRMAQGWSEVVFSTSGAVPRFPFVIIPGLPLDFTLTFKDPERVSNVKVYSGGVQGIGEQLDDGRFSARLGFPWWNGTDYGIYVAYETKNDAGELSSAAPTLDQVRHMMPSVFRDFLIVDSGPLLSEQAGNTGAAYVDFLPSPDLPWFTGRVEMTVTKNATDYTPDGKDLQLAESTGVPVYGFSMSDSLTDNEWVIETECYMPQDLLMDSEAGGQSMHSAAGVGALVKVGARVAFSAEGAYQVASTVDSLSTALRAGDVFERLSRLADYAARNCFGSPKSQYYQDSCDSLARQGLAGEGTKAALIAAGVVLAPETFGLGTLLLWGVAKGIEWAVDREIDQNIKALALQIAGDANCNRDEDPDRDLDDPEPKEKVAELTPIWDPSGYVYEAVPDNRLQGVTSTVMEKDTGLAEWHVWDAEWFGQVNPQVTNDEGKYGWDVPAGEWHVVYQKEGYEVAQSDDLTVPPPHFDVNVGLVSLASPEVAGVTPAEDGSYVDISFSKYMRASTLTGSTISVSNRAGGETGDTLEGSVSAVDPVLAGGVHLASAARFTPDENLETGGEYEVWVNAVVQSYAGSPMIDDVTRVFVVEETQDPGDDDDDDEPHGGGGNGGQGAPLGLTYILGPHQGSIEAAGGNVAIRYGQNVFSSGSSIRVAQVPGAITGLHGLVPVTPAYEFHYSGPRMSRRAEVSFRYDKAALGAISPLLLGVYRQDEHVPSKWVYVGGVVDVTESTVTVMLSGFSRYAVMAKDITFSDTTAHWARECIQVLAARDLVNGVTESTFEPDRQITRAELAKMLVLMNMRSSVDDIAFEVPQIPTFADVGPGTWYFPYVETAAANGIVKGENGFFRPTDPVTRQELATMVVRAMGLEEKADLLKGRKPEFDDALDVSQWAYGYLGLALFKGLIRGVTDTTLEPLSSATRAQAAAVILRAMERLGLVSTLKDMGGVLRVSDVEGRHFELDTLVEGSPVTYVLIPDGGMDGVIATRLEGQVGKHVDVRGVLEDGVSIFMSGPVLRVLTVLLPGCVLCEP